MLGFAGRWANVIGHVEECTELCRASLECSHAAGLAPASTTLQFLGITALESNHPEEAIAYCEEAVAVAREHDDEWAQMMARSQLAIVCLFGGEPERGRMLADETLTAARRIGEGYLLTMALLVSGQARRRHPTRGRRRAPPRVDDRPSLPGQARVRSSRLLPGNRPAAPRTASGGGSLDANLPRHLPEAWRRLLHQHRHRHRRGRAHALPSPRLPACCSVPSTATPQSRVRPAPPPTSQPANARARVSSRYSAPTPSPMHGRRVRI